MLRDQTLTESFAGFFSEAEPRLRRALTAAYGAEVGREAAADALVYGWRHWDRVTAMANPIGYLFRVGQSSARRMLHRRVRLGLSPSEHREPWIEPALSPALERLTDRQRVVVSLIHAFDWSMAEVAELLGTSKATVQSYERRAMRKR